MRSFAFYLAAAVAEIGDRPYPAPEPDGSLALLVTGGSQGATVMADVVPAALASLPAALRPRLRVVQQCRAADLARVRTAYESAGVAADVASGATICFGRAGQALIDCCAAPLESMIRATSRRARVSREIFG